MKGRDHQGKGPASTDLLVCFPTRAHLTIMPKRINCSPSRPSEINTRHLTRHHTRKCSNLASSGGGHASPLLWAKTNKHKNNNNNINNNSDDMSEPTSPKVTCAGQIKVRPKPGCKNWQSVVEEIERIHNKGKKKRATWTDAIGLKKDVMQFLTCLRHIRFDFRCFGSFTANSDVTSDDEDEDEDEEEIKDENCGNGDVFSKWFMILQENNQGPQDERVGKSTVVDDNDDDGPCAPPPPNALLLMRCRSAPAKSWLEEKEEEEEEKEEEEKEKEKESERKENLVVMKYGADLSKISCDIAKETWVVGGIQNMLSRSRSSKR